MRVAFKEWAVVVDALERGRQIIILRKGGIREGRAGFQVEHPEFLLFPTLFHQQRDSVLPEAQARFDKLAPDLRDPSHAQITSFAKIVCARCLDSLDAAKRLQGQHIWRDEVIAQRFEWGREKNIFALAVRVYRLAHEVSLPMSPAYGGCKSWIELERDIDTSAAAPVLDDRDFAEKLEAFQTALPSHNTPVLNHANIASPASAEGAATARS
jgi:hypothetical protein